MAGALLLGGLLMAGAGAASPAGGEPPPSPPKVTVYESDARSYHVNAHWVESAQGMILVDSLLLRSDAERLARMMKSSGKPLLAILITHPHVDHFSGSGVVRKHFGPVPVCATRATAAGMPRALAKAKAQGWLKPLGDDFDEQVVMPDCILEPEAETRFGDILVRVHDLGPMESENNSVFHLPAADALFGGDAMVANAIYFVGDGRSQVALAGLRDLAQRFPAQARVYSGHYQPQSLGPLVQDNIRQVERMQEVLAAIRAEPDALTDSGALTAAARSRAVQALVGAAGGREGYGMDPRVVTSMNLQGLLREWRQSRQPAGGDTVQDGGRK